MSDIFERAGSPTRKTPTKTKTTRKLFADTPPPKPKPKKVRFNKEEKSEEKRGAKVLPKEKTGREKILELYYDPKTGLTSPKKLWERMKKLGYNVTLKAVKEAVGSQEIDQVFRQVQRKKEQYSAIISPGKRNNYQMDLIEFPKFKKANDNYRYAMVCIDVWSRYAVAVPLKKKETQPMIRAWRKTVNLMGEPRNLNTDEEGAVMGKEFQDLLREQGIKHWAWGPENKANNQVIERLNRTLRQVLRKMMRVQKTKRWIQFISDLFDNYNTTRNEAVRGVPQEIWEGKEDPNPKNIRQVPPQFEVGDTVRVEKAYDLFAKKSEAKTHGKSVYTVIEVPKQGEGKQVTVRNSKGKVLTKTSYKLQKVGSRVEDRSKKETKEEKTKRKTKEEKIKGEERSARAMAKEGLTEPVEKPKARTRTQARKKQDDGAVSMKNAVSGRRRR